MSHDYEPDGHDEAGTPYWSVDLYRDDRERALDVGKYIFGGRLYYREGHHDCISLTGVSWSMTMAEGEKLLAAITRMREWCMTTGTGVRSLAYLDVDGGVARVERIWE